MKNNSLDDFKLEFEEIRPIKQKIRDHRPKVKKPPKIRHNYFKEAYQLIREGIFA